MKKKNGDIKKIFDKENKVYFIKRLYELIEHGYMLEDSLEFLLIQYDVPAVEIEKIKSKHSSSQFLAIDACLGSASNIGNIQIREGPILPGKGVGKKLPQVGTYSIVGIVDKIDENNRFSFNNIRLHFILELAETIALSLLLAT